LGWYQAELLAVSVMGVFLEGKEVGQLFLHITTVIIYRKSLTD